MKIQQNITNKLSDLNHYSDAMINILKGYCENYQQNPPSGCLFDVLAGLNLLKEYSDEMSETIEHLYDYC